MIHHYAWGDPAFIPELLGLDPDGRPWAELWLGTHAAGPSALDDGTPLASVSGPLPYLLKVIACAAPLSLQTHPNDQQAKDGFARGVFADPNSKPELLCALTPFQAFCGLRPTAGTLDLLGEIGADEIRHVLSGHGPTATLASMYHGDIDIDAAIEVCARSNRPEAEWVRRLAAAYPGDPAAVATLLLNHVVLEPGDALRLQAGQLHAYLHGAGIELMGPSDNVVRGGLTEKHVDVDELLRIADSEALEEPTLRSSTRYELIGADVALVRLEPGQRHVAKAHELSVDLLGNTWYLAPGDEMTIDVTTYVVTN